MKLVSGRAGLAFRFAGPDAALGLGGRAASEAVEWPLSRSPSPAGQVGVLGRGGMGKNLDEQTIIVV